MLCHAALALAFGAVAFVAMRWTLAHPRIGGWDEIGYIALALRDRLLMLQEGFGAWRDSVLVYYRFQTPGPRLFGLPLLALGAYDATGLRLLSLAMIAASAAVLWDAVRRIAGAAPAAVAAASFLLMPVVVRSAQNWMAEPGLYLAIAALFWGLARELAGPPARGWTVAVFAVACAVGLLARFSFVLVLGPALVVAVAGALVGWLPRLLAVRFALGAAIGGALVWPVYALSLARLIGYARFAVTWPNDLLVADGTFAFLLLWGEVFAAAVVGPVVLVLLLAATLRALRLLAGLGARPMPPALALLAFAGAIIAPFLLSHLTGANQNPRYLAPALPAFAVLIGLGVSGSDRWCLAGGALVAVQAVWLAVVAVMPGAGVGLASEMRELSWRENRVCDLRPLVARSPAQGTPRIMGFGGNDPVNHVQIEFAFTGAGRFAFVRPFGNPGTEAPDWAGDLDEAAHYDLVVVTDPAPPLASATPRAVPPRNIHALGYVERLSADPRFEAAGLPGNDCPMAVFAVRPGAVRDRQPLSPGGVSLRAINVAP